MDFVIIANMWSAGVDNPTSKHRIALDLAARGHRVLWLEAAGMRSPSLGSNRDRSRILQKLRAVRQGARRVMGAGAGGSVWVVTPLPIPLPGYAAIRWLNGRLYGAVGKFWSRRLGFVDPVLINYAPVLPEAMLGWARRTREGAVRAVYYCVDRWDAFAMYDSAMMAQMDRRCCRCADLVVATSQDLLERCRRHNANTHLITHGVDHGHFAQALALGQATRPADLPAGPLVGFFGLLSEWVDQALLVTLARSLPDVRIVLIGASDVEVGALAAEPNILLLGPKPFRDLPAYAAHFTVGIIPFLVNELTQAVNPVKLREMLAAGCPVVSTALPEVACYVDGTRGLVAAAERGAFVDAVGALVRNPLDLAARSALSRRMSTETWTAKVGALLDLLQPR